MEGASWQPTTYGNLYEALEKPGTQIRLLKFSSGPQVGILRLDTSVWDVADPPPYVAISYTWGPPKMRLIFINKAAIKVHHNAFYALWQVRQHFSDRYIWIDSISIHQGDTTEKSAQVEMIYQIYRKAWRVAACLGEHTHDGNWLLAMAQSLARLNREVELTRQIASNSEDGTSNQQSPILTYIYDGLGVHE
ncbi:hypothetical protein CKM354_000972100 [Cercospora kikuchii]|uniref:Heterokaryon incompatibility domain-containing protein n=1 Tax=Cercospora kikuchii TaxID=84275 RepID=A0A9P3CQ14_9PEZI|nr:uncharacterized protein CKM354_000972100 [Cercospora kikuchii]GIZ46601.1 hypothetical protein CKM354_000972100 [Cercospora kikuchii]